MRKILFCFLLFILIGCATTRPTTEDIMNSWIGHSKQELIMSWGIPAKTSSDGNGGEVYAYCRQGTIYFSEESLTVQNCMLIFINESGMIYHWMNQRSTVPPQQMDVNIYKRY